MKRKVLFVAFLATVLALSACTLAPQNGDTEIVASLHTDTAPPQTDLLLPPPEASVPLAEATVTHKGSVVEGVTLSVKGSAVVLQFPLDLPQSVLENASVSFTLSDGTLLPPQTLDLTVENTLEIPDEEGYITLCTLRAERQSYALPVMEIHTDSGQPITEKTLYAHATVTVDGVEYPMQIKGRGNASWNHFPKKSYRIKLDKGAKLFGLPQNRDWVLTCNYADKSLIRNCVAHTLSATLSGIEYTPTHIPLHLYINGEYLGVYTFGDKIENGNGRLDLGDPVYEGEKLTDVGFLIEIGWDFNDENLYNRDYFDTDVLRRLFVKDPEIQVALAPEMRIIKNYVLQTEKAIVTNNGWENYIDVDSFVDWFILNELTFNTESSFYRSCYFWRPVGGKLNMGPVWDFDMAFGNHLGDLRGYSGWCTTESTYEYITENWMDYLMTYPAFTDRLVARWNEVKDGLLVTALTAVDEYSGKLEGSQQANFRRWNIMSSAVGMGAVNRYEYNTYEKQVQYLRNFLQTRWTYMDTRLNSSEYNSAT